MTGPLALACASPSAPAERALPVDLILDRWADALGGREKLQALKTTYTKSRYESSGGTGVVEEWTTSQIQRRQHNRLDTGEELLVYDGSEGWNRSNGRVRSLSADESAGQRTAAFIGSHTHLVSSDGARIEYVGEDESRSNFILRVSPEGAHPTIFYLDKFTYLPTRNQQQLPTTVLEIWFEGWQDLNGVKIPRRTRLTTNDGYEATETIIEVRHNDPLAPDLFARPADGPADYRFVSGGTSARVAMNFDSGYVLVHGRLNGSPPAWLLLDTGASGSVLDLDFARSLGVPLRGRPQLTGAGGTVEASYATGVRVLIGDVELSDQTFFVTPLEFLPATQGQRIAGILGFDLFSRFVVQIDYGARQVHLYEPRSFQYNGGGAVLPIDLHSNQPYVRAQLGLSGRPDLDGEYVVDLGSSNTLMLASDYASAHGIVSSLGKTVEVPSLGVGGEFPMKVGRLEGLKLGPFSLANPIAYFPPGEIAARGRAGNVGGALLRRFRVTFDYSREQMMLERTPQLLEPEEFDMSGLRLGATASASDGVRVSHVMDDSPARQCGIQPGDLILTVDGRPAGAIPLIELRELLRKDGAEIGLQVQSGSAARQVLLKLRRLL